MSDFPSTCFSAGNHEQAISQDTCCCLKWNMGLIKPNKKPQISAWKWKLWACCLEVCGWHTDTVPHPGTVVVELGDAAVAHGAVFGPDGLPYLRGHRHTSIKSRLITALVLCVIYFSSGASQNLPSRYCRICSGPGCPSLPAPQLSGGRKQETKAWFHRSTPERWQKNELTAEKFISPRSIWHGNKRPTDSVRAAAGISSRAITLEARLIHGQLGQKLLQYLQFHSFSFFSVLKAKYLS